MNTVEYSVTCLVKCTFDTAYLQQTKVAPLKVAEWASLNARGPDHTIRTPRGFQGK